MKPKRRKTPRNLEVDNHRLYLDTRPSQYSPGTGSALPLSKQQVAPIRRRADAESEGFSANAFIRPRDQTGRRCSDDRATEDTLQVIGQVDPSVGFSINGIMQISWGRADVCIPSLA
jgi:hypothetical protein